MMTEMRWLSHIELRQESAQREQLTLANAVKAALTFVFNDFLPSSKSSEQWSLYVYLADARRYLVGGAATLDAAEELRKEAYRVAEKGWEVFAAHYLADENH
jgi:hypothetical protein